MAEIVLAQVPERNIELVFDTEDIESYHTPCDIIDRTPPDAEYVSREIGARYLTIKFKPGKAAQWRTMTAVVPGLTPPEGLPVERI